MKLAIDTELHSDLERLLLSDGSEQENLWCINFYPEADEEDLVEFDSLSTSAPARTT